MAEKLPAKGEVWFVDLTDGKGHEQQGMRPGIILANFAALKMSLLVPVTSNLSTSRFPATLRLSPTRENGLQTESVALIFQTTSVDHIRLVRCTGQLSKDDQNKIDAILKDELRIT